MHTLQASALRWLFCVAYLAYLPPAYFLPLKSYLGLDFLFAGFRHMFGWNVFGLLLMGPAVATERFFDTLNKVERELNCRGGN